MQNAEEKIIACDVCGIEFFSCELHCVTCRTALPLTKDGPDSNKEIMTNYLYYMDEHSDEEYCLELRLDKGDYVVNATSGPREGGLRQSQEKIRTKNHSVAINLFGEILREREEKGYKIEVLIS